MAKGTESRAPLGSAVSFPPFCVRISGKVPLGHCRVWSSWKKHSPELQSWVWKVSLGFWRGRIEKRTPGFSEQLHLPSESWDWQAQHSNLTLSGEPLLPSIKEKLLGSKDRQALKKSLTSFGMRLVYNHFYCELCLCYISAKWERFHVFQREAFWDFYSKRSEFTFFLPSEHMILYQYPLLFWVPKKKEILLVWLVS